MLYHHLVTRESFDWFGSKLTLQNLDYPHRVFCTAYRNELQFTNLKSRDNSRTNWI
jgi:hypothetical protein